MARRRRRTGKIKFDKKVATNTAIASLITQQLPGFVANKLIKTTSPLSDGILKAIGAGGCIAYGMIFKNNDVANAGVTLAAMDIVNNAVSGMLGSNLSAPALNDFVRIPAGSALSDYSNNLSIVGSDRYSNTYLQN